MGADLIMAVVVLKGRKPTYPELRRKMEKATNKITAAEKKRFLAEWEEQKGSPLDADDDVETEMKAIIKTFFETLGARDTTYFTHKNSTIWMTGGMSWGDSPSDSYDAFNDVYLLPERILKAGGIE